MSLEKNQRTTVQYVYTPQRDKNRNIGNDDLEGGKTQCSVSGSEFRFLNPDANPKSGYFCLLAKTREVLSIFMKSCF